MHSVVWPSQGSGHGRAARPPALARFPREFSRDRCSPGRWYRSRGEVNAPFAPRPIRRLTTFCRDDSRIGRRGAPPGGLPDTRGEGDGLKGWALCRPGHNPRPQSINSPQNRATPTCTSCDINTSELALRRLKLDCANNGGSKDDGWDKRFAPLFRQYFRFFPCGLGVGLSTGSQPRWRRFRDYEPTCKSEVELRTPAKCRPAHSYGDVAQ